MSTSIKKLIKNITVHNTRTMVTIEEWAQTLTYQEYSKFKESQKKNNLLLENYVKSGQLKIVSITEPVSKEVYDFNTSTFQTRNVQMKIGEEYILSEELNEIPTDQDFLVWENRYNKEFKNLAMKKILKR